MLRIGTDCSGGIESPILALKELGYKFEHKWSCEIDKHCQLYESQDIMNSCSFNVKEGKPVS